MIIDQLFYFHHRMTILNLSAPMQLLALTDNSTVILKLYNEHEVYQKPNISVIRKEPTMPEECEGINRGKFQFFFQKAMGYIIHMMNYVVNTCSCRHFLKLAYCEHLLHTLKTKNLDSEKLLPIRDSSAKVITGQLSVKEVRVEPLMQDLLWK